MAFFIAASSSALMALTLASVENLSLAAPDDLSNLREPDTLSMTFPREVSWLASLDETVQILVGCEGEPITLTLAELPVVVSTEPYHVKFIVEDVPEDFDVNGRYCLVNPNINRGNILYASLFNSLAGVDINDPATINILGSYDSPANGLPNVIKIQTPEGSYEYERNWIPPKFFTSSGTVDNVARQNCSGQPEVSSYVEYSDECLSSIQVVSRGAYQARIQVYDNTGKFVHASVQNFGKCGELENNTRDLEGGKVSWLVWNMKDPEQNPVSNGVYIWKVQFVSENAQPFTAIYKQGIARNTVVACGEL